MNAAHPFVRDEHDIGRSLAEQFLARVAEGPIECDALGSFLALARQGSLARGQAFAARIQAELVARCRDA